MNEKNEVDKLFDNLQKDEVKEADIFDEKNIPEKDKEPEKEPEIKNEVEKEPYKNRRHRRLEEQLQQEREARIRAEAIAQERVNAIVDKDDIDPRWIQIYGDTPEAKLAWKLQKDILKDQLEAVKQSTLEQIEKEKRQQEEEQEKYESFIDSQLENLEDEFNVDLTSNSPTARKSRREFLEMIEQLSPKDANGEILGYADFNATWEIYQSRKTDSKPDASRNKQIASLSMTNNNGKTTSTKEITPGFRGWMKDYEL